MNRYVIENNVPLPKDRVGLTTVLQKLAIGQSVLLPMKEASGIYQYARQLGVKFTQRKENDKEIRVWRVE